MFSFVISYLNFLKYIPLFPHVFDSLLRVWVLVTKPKLLNWLDEIEGEVLNWQGTNVSIHKYGGLQFNYRGTEIGHIHSNGLLDVLYTLKIKEVLLKTGRVSNHHVFAKSGWISFYIKRTEDKKYALELLWLKYQDIHGGNTESHRVYLVDYQNAITLCEPLYFPLLSSVRLLLEI
ncbi:MAG: hypothetical protein JWN56_1929 [Sphingobacteriales bacterium]|nr:hypothetical protein [Sphingobacteriales bacterium]